MAGAPLGVDAEAERLTRQIGARVAELRREKGWSQKAFAKALNNTVQWVSLVETGKQNMRVHTLVRLAMTLEVQVVDLFSPPGPEPKGVRRGRPRKLA